MKPRTVILAALVAGALGLVAGLLSSGGDALWRTRAGQWLLQSGFDATAPRPDRVPVAEIDRPVPAFRLRDLDGAMTDVPARWAGRPLLINVWASWCGPCLKEMPELQRFSAAQRTDGVQVVGIALDDPQAVRAFLQRVPVRYPQLIDAPGAADAGVRLGNLRGVLPYSVLIDAHGTLRARRVGPFAPGELDAFVASAE